MAGAPQFSTGDHFSRKLGVFYAAYFFFNGIQLPFFPLWLGARGLDAQTIGFVIAVPMVVRIIATPLITHWADRRRALRGRRWWDPPIQAARDCRDCLCPWISPSPAWPARAGHGEAFPRLCVPPRALREA